MSDRAVSWHYGDARPVITKAVPTANVIEVGDMVQQAAGGDITAISATVWDTSLAVTQETAIDTFLGIAQERSRVGDVEPIRVDTHGVHEFDCAAATFELGALVGPAKQSGNALENQKVVAVATTDLAIGRVAKRYGSNTTKVLVDVRGFVTEGGVQAPT